MRAIVGAIVIAAAPLLWQSDWKTAFATAQRSGRLVFVDFYATWCAPCREMEKEFETPQFHDRLAQFVLLRIDGDKTPIGRAQKVAAFPTYVVYDPREAERFRIVGAPKRDVMAGALDSISEVAPALLRASRLFADHRDLDGEFLVGNAYNRLRLGDLAREAYKRAHEAADLKHDTATAQLADALFAFTYAREGDARRAIGLLQKLAAKPVDRNTEALIWLTIGNAHRLAKDETSAIEAYKRAQSLATPGTTAYEEATAALTKAP